MSIEKQKKCFYLDSDYQPASDMLRECVGDINTPYKFGCDNNPMRQEMPEDVKETARMNDISIQRGFSYYNIDNHNKNSFVDNKKPVINNDFLGKFGLEGFQNNIFITDNGLGESSIPKGECPEGYSIDLSSGKCIQKCINCVYKDNMKSREFNEADPCFPNGVYNGVTNEGFIKCTCGKDNKYCSDNFTKNLFTTNGMMVNGQKIIMNTGLTKTIDELFNFDYL
tara:strand:- start:193 stop:867 length:675 start_codon:yes stop_codon:yes gene_type:complete